MDTCAHIELSHDLQGKTVIPIMVPSSRCLYRAVCTVKRVLESKGLDQEWDMKVYELVGRDSSIEPEKKPVKINGQDMSYKDSRKKDIERIIAKAITAK